MRVVVKARHGDRPDQLHLPLECPVCGGSSIFTALTNDYLIGDDIAIAMRYCLNKSCSALALVRTDCESKTQQVLYPQYQLKYDSSNIPDSIRKTFEETLGCFTNGYYTAAAIMARRTLEEVCADKGAVGRDLYTRLENLKNTIVIPESLVMGMREIKSLGNDAAHVEAKEYENISEEEVMIALDIVKLVLQSIYQIDHIVLRMQALKKTAPSS